MSDELDLDDDEEVGCNYCGDPHGCYCEPDNDPWGVPEDPDVTEEWWT